MDKTLQGEGFILCCAHSADSCVCSFSSPQIFQLMQLLSCPAPGSPTALWSVALSGGQLLPATLLESFVMGCFWQKTTYAWLSLSPAASNIDLQQVLPMRHHSDFCSCDFLSNVQISALGVGEGLFFGQWISLLGKLVF